MNQSQFSSTFFQPSFSSTQFNGQVKESIFQINFARSDIQSCYIEFEAIGDQNFFQYQMKLKCRDFHTSNYECAIPLKTQQLYKYRYTVMSKNILEGEEKFRYFKLNQEQENYVDEWNKVWCVYQFRWNKQEYFNEFEESKITDSQSLFTSRIQDSIKFESKQLIQTNDILLSQQFQNLIFESTQKMDKQQNEEIIIYKHQEIYLNSIVIEITFGKLGRFLANTIGKQVKDKYDQLNVKYNSQEQMLILLQQENLHLKETIRRLEIELIKEQVKYREGNQKLILQLAEEKEKLKLQHNGDTEKLKLEQSAYQNSLKQTINQLQEQILSDRQNYQIEIQEIQKYSCEKAGEYTQIIQNLQDEIKEYKHLEIQQKAQQMKIRQMELQMQAQIPKNFDEIIKLLESYQDKVNQLETLKLEYCQAIEDNQKKGNQIIQKKNTQFQQKIKQCEESLKQATEKLNQKEEELSKLQENNKQELQIIMCLKNQILIQKQDLEKYKIELQEIQRKLEISEQENDKLQKLNESSKNEIELQKQKTQKMIEDSQKKQQQTLQQIQEGHEVEKQKIIKDLKSQIKNEITLSQEQIKRRDNEINLLKQEKNQILIQQDQNYNLQIQNTQNSYDKEILEKEKLIRELKMQLENNNNQLLDVNEQYEKLTQEYQNYKAQKEEDLKKLEIRNEQLKQQIFELNNAQIKYQQIIIDHNEQIEQLKQVHNRSLETLNQVIDSNKQLQQQVAQQNKTIDQMHNNSSQIVSENTQIIQKYQQELDNNSKLSQEQIKQQAKIKQMESEMQAKEKDLESLQQQNNKTIQESKKQQEKALEQIQKKHEVEKQKIISDLEKKERIQKEHVVEKQKIISDLEKKLKSETDQIKEKKEKIDNLEQDMKNAQLQIKNLLGEKEYLQKKSNKEQEIVVIFSELYPILGKLMKSNNNI